MKNIRVISSRLQDIPLTIISKRMLILLLRISHWTTLKLTELRGSITISPMFLALNMEPRNQSTIKNKMVGISHLS